MSITTPKGFVAAGLASGIKASGALDLALLATDDGVAVPTAATFTTNLAAAAPVQVSRDHLAAAGGRSAAVVVSSGNANAATGRPGRANAERMCELTADGLGVSRRTGPGLLDRSDQLPAADGAHRGGHPGAGGVPLGLRARRPPTPPPAS